MKKQINNIVLASTMILYPLASVPVYAEETSQQTQDTSTYSCQGEGYKVDVKYDSALESDPGLITSKATSNLQALQSLDPSKDFSDVNTSFYQISTTTSVSQKAHVTMTFNNAIQGAEGSDFSVYQITDGKATKINATYTSTQKSVTFDADSLSTFAISTAAVKTFTVTFTDGQGNALGDVQTVNYGQSAQAPENPTREGYTFTGWDNSNYSNVTSDLTITAQWSANSYAINYDLNGGTNATSNPSSYTTGSSVTLSDPTKEGSTFTGWTSTEIQTPTKGVVVSGTGDKSFIANWQVNTYTVKFVDGSGNTLDTQTVEYGKSANAPSNPTKDGYTFTGWDVDYSNVKSDITVTAQWTQNQTTDDTKKTDENKNTDSTKNESKTKEEVKYGNLTISNTVSGEDQSFTYQIYFTKDDKVVSDSFNYTGSVQGSLKNGSEFTLSNGQSITIENIPVGVNYSIVEKEANGDYKTSVSGNTVGTIVEGTTSISFVNEKTTFLKIKGILRAKVTLDNQAASGSTYQFQLKDANGNVIQVKSNNNDSIEFDPIQFTQEGTFVYYISQIEGTDKKISYDNSVYKETITISMKDGKYVATTSYQKDGKEYNGVPVFKNRSKQVAVFGARTSTETNTGLYVGVAAVAVAAIGFLGFKSKKKK